MMQGKLEEYDLCLKGITKCSAIVVDQRVSECGCTTSEQCVVAGKIVGVEAPMVGRVRFAFDRVVGAFFGFIWHPLVGIQ